MYDKSKFHQGLIFTIEDPFVKLAKSNLQKKFIDLQ